MNSRSRSKNQQWLATNEEPAFVSDISDPMKKPTMNVEW